MQHSPGAAATTCPSTWSRCETHESLIATTASTDPEQGALDESSKSAAAVFARTVKDPVPFLLRISFSIPNVHWIFIYIVPSTSSLLVGTSSLLAGSWASSFGLSLGADFMHGFWVSSSAMLFSPTTTETMGRSLQKGCRQVGHGMRSEGCS